MGRNNERNAKQHNDKLHKARQKQQRAALALKEKRAGIMKKFNGEKTA
jgi:hypothetical protein